MRKPLGQVEAEARDVSEAEQAALTELGQNFAHVWQSAHCPPDLKKRIIRAVVEEVIVNLDDATQLLSFVIHWKGGVHTTLEMPRPRSAVERKTAQEGKPPANPMGAEAAADG